MTVRPPPPNCTTPQASRWTPPGTSSSPTSGNNRIREVNLATGVITTVAGNGTGGYSGDNGPATAAELDDPRGVAVDAAGDLFIADYGNNLVREVNHATGVITTVAGNGIDGYSGDNGPATAAELDHPHGRRGGRRRGPLHRRLPTTT